MKKHYVHHLLILSICSVTTVHEIVAQVYYDDCPKTIKRNADIGTVQNIDPANGYVAPNFVLMGRSWNRRILTFAFQNGTPDIINNEERQAVRDGFALWAAQTNIAFIEVCDVATADMVFLWGQAHMETLYLYALRESAHLTVLVECLLINWRAGTQRLRCTIR